MKLFISKEELTRSVNSTANYIAHNNSKMRRDMAINIEQGEWYAPLIRAAFASSTKGPTHREMSRNINNTFKDDPKRGIIFYKMVCAAASTMIGYEVKERYVIPDSDMDNLVELPTHVSLGVSIKTGEDIVWGNNPCSEITIADNSVCSVGIRLDEFLRPLKPTKPPEDIKMSYEAKFPVMVGNTNILEATDDQLTNIIRGAKEQLEKDADMIAVSTKSILVLTVVPHVPSCSPTAIFSKPVFVVYVLGISLPLD